MPRKARNKDAEIRLLRQRVWRLEAALRPFADSYHPEMMGNTRVTVINSDCGRAKEALGLDTEASGEAH